MEFAVVCLASAVAACLTFVSGFGFGTLMLPVFALFFPVEIAVAATAVVHLARQFMKLGLIGRWADRRIVLRFAPTAAVGAIAGAFLLAQASRLEPLVTYTLAGRTHAITPIKAVMGALILAATAMEALPALSKLAAAPRWLPLGGALSGFFGGLSGHQGALRMIFLRRWGLSKEALLGTSAVCAVVIDSARLAVYGAEEWRASAGVFGDAHLRWLVVAACAAAFVGSVGGARVVKKIEMRVVERAITAMLVITALLLGSGLI